MGKMFDEGTDEYDATRDIHREEKKSRIKLDAQDRNKVFREMETQILYRQTLTILSTYIQWVCCIRTRQRP